MVQQNTGAAAKICVEQPERLAAAWRRARFSEAGGRDLPDSLIDGLVEDLIRQIGRTLGGESGHPWARTRGVLRVSLVRGPQALADEFDALRRCIYDALAVVSAEAEDFNTVSAILNDAIDSATTLARGLENPDLPPPRVPFGGLVVEVVEGQPRPAVGRNAVWPLRVGLQ